MSGDLFTTESFATLATASFIVVIVSNVLQHVFNFNPKWLGLILALTVSFLGVFLTDKTGTIYIIALFNGFLIYANAVGIVQITGKKESTFNNTNQPYGVPNIPENKRSFGTKWY